MSSPQSVNVSERMNSHQQVALVTVAPQKRTWTDVYSLTESLLSSLESNKGDNSANTSHEGEGRTLVFNFRFGSYLRKLEKRAIIIEHELACLSTLGGAYHLCNKPEVALNIARRQELVGRRLGSTNLVIRALVFQAVNLRILGRKEESQATFDRCYQLLKSNPWLEDSRNFVAASQLWLERTYGSNELITDSSK